MDTASYISLTRQSGLMREMRLVANNIANAGTDGYRREGMVFAEHIVPLRDEPSLSMGYGNGRALDLSQAGLSQTKGQFDLALEGDGFFKIRNTAGDQLTRAGQFTLSEAGELVTSAGGFVLDSNDAPIILPFGQAISVAEDGTISADGIALAQIGLWQPDDAGSLLHMANTSFGFGEATLSATTKLRQGFLEDSNVNPISEIARMIEVQRAYELGQSFLEAEDRRGRSTVETLSK